MSGIGLHPDHRGRLRHKIRWHPPRLRVVEAEKGSQYLGYIYRGGARGER